MYIGANKVADRKARRLLEHVIVIMNTVAVPCQTTCLTDIIFVMDESGSISSSEFTLMKSFLSRLVGRLDIDCGGTRVGLVTFGSTVGTVFNFADYTSVASLQTAISSLSKAGGGTRTHSALQYVRMTLLTPEAGDRADVCNIVIVLTDGKSDDDAATQVSVSVYYTVFFQFYVDIFI